MLRNITWLRKTIENKCFSNSLDLFQAVLSKGQVELTVNVMFCSSERILPVVHDTVYIGSY